MSDSQQERTEEATEKRRREFREKGQVAQSKELGMGLQLSAALLLWFFYASMFWEGIEKVVGGIWSQAGERAVTPESMLDLMGVIMTEVTLLLAPPLLVVLLIGAASTLAQVGFLFTAKPLAPDLNKINPIQGLGRMFSKRSLVEMVKSLIKVLVVGWVAYQTLEGYFEQALHLSEHDLVETVAFMGQVAAMVLFKCSGILILLGILDFFYARWEMEEKMKMTKQEQKEEHKETEGNPQVKAKVRSIQQAMARKRMMAEVPTADVVVTNPTHLSVALAYRQGEMAAPKVVAKGADELALRIRTIARENKVPIVENKPVARALYKIELEHYVPEELYKAVAEILAYVYGLKKG